MRTSDFTIGQAFIVSFAEDLPTDDTLYFIQDNAIGGVILFANHCQDVQSVRHWLADFKKTLNRPFIVAVDQEGGRVRRFRKGFPPLEAPRYYAYRDRFSEYQRDVSRTCEKLYETGINLNLTPCVDLFDGGEDHVLDSRTFSDDLETVVKYSSETIAIHREQGLLCCAKHFPGLGRTTGDPHKVLSAADLTEKDFFEVELKPYRELLERGLDAVMVTHIALPKVDNKPTLISEKMITGWLKEHLEFTGPVISDDLLMDGATLIDPTPGLSVKAFNAGIDFLLFGQNIEKAREMYDACLRAIEGKGISDTRLADAALRIRTFCGRIPG